MTYVHPFSTVDVSLLSISQTRSDMPVVVLPVLYKLHKTRYWRFVEP